AFNRVSGGNVYPETEQKQKLSVLNQEKISKSEMMLVAGYSGVGKTAVVNEVHKPIVGQRGYFIKGKFDQFQRNIPFSAFVQSLRDLMGQLLSENDAQLQQWKDNILAAVGENGQVIIEVIPELEKIIGEQPRVAELSGSAGQNRFNLLFQKFIQVFTTKEHPLVIFLDDLQWADSASFKLIQLLMKEADSQYLLLIGAYRDNEVNPAHPLMLTLDEIKKQDAIVNTITLAPLRQDDLNQLVADTLHCSLQQALPLTEAVYQKTEGNPFFATQFLKALYEDKLIYFNAEEGLWQCDLAQVKLASVSEDVVEFVGKRLQKLNPLTQETMKLAACIGNQFDLETLAIVRETSELETATDLWLALKEGLILPTTEVYKFYTTENIEVNLTPTKNHLSANYKFLHDRIQQAAYSLIPEEQKQQTHLKIGRLLLEKIPESEQQDRLFDIVNQLNIGADLIDTQAEGNQLAHLNLEAGRKAKASTAYKAAVEYLSTGLKQLDTDSWQTQYNLIFNLHIELAEAEYLTDNFEQAYERLEAIFKFGKDLIDRSLAYELKIQMEIAQERMLDAIDTTFYILKKLDINLTSELKNQFAVENLINLPMMTIPDKLAAMRILMAVIPAAYVAKAELLLPITVTMVQLSIDFGNSPIAAFAYVFYGVLLCGFSGEIELGYQFGQLSLKVLDKFEATSLKCKVYHLYNAMVRPWKEHTKATVEPLLESIQSGGETGDQEYSSYSVGDYCTYQLLAGKRLDSLTSVYAKYLELCKKLKPDYMAITVEIRSKIIQNLVQTNLEKPTITVLKLNEDEMWKWLKDSQLFAPLLAAYLSKAFLYYLVQDYAQAVEYYHKSEDYLNSTVGKLYASERNFYYSLALLGLVTQTQTDNQDLQSTLEEVETNQKQLNIWAAHAPMNFLHKFYLVEAEKHRVLGKKLEAMELYDLAIAGAKANEYIQEEALANELAAKFYLNLGRKKVAKTYMIEAYYCYSHWGAKAKTKDLEQRYPQLLAPILEQKKINLNPLKTITNSEKITTKTQPTLSSNTTEISE
ncbi:MAG: AAA family ATPase, partial [Microcoleaceae cyanobacterium]